MTDAPAGWITIGAAAIWAGKSVSALMASRRAKTRPSRRDRAEKWQWLALAAVMVILGVWDIAGPSAHPAVLWWITAGFGALLASLFITDIGPWLRSRLSRNSHHAPS
jgi:hypothetical protein